MLSHHPTVGDRSGSQSHARINSGIRGASSKRTTQLKTAVCNQLRQNLMTGSAALLERRRMCAGIVPPSPLHPSRIPLPHTLPRVYDISSLMAGGYSWQYPVRQNHVVMTTGSDVAGPSSMMTPTRPDVVSPLSTYVRRSADDALSHSSCAKYSERFSAAHYSSVTSLTTDVVTPSTTTTTTPLHVADSGIASRRRRSRATPDAVGRTRARLQHSRRSFLFAADRHASDDSSSTASDEPTAVSSSSPIVRDASTKQLQYGEVADSTSLPTSDSAYSDADEVPDVAGRQ